MDARKFVIGSIVGGIVIFVLGYTVFELLLGSYFDSRRTEAVLQTMREAPAIWAVGVGCLAWAALICYAMGARAGAAAGAKVGAVVGVLLWATADFFMYGFQTLIELPMTIIDPLLSGVLSAIAGAVIGVVLSKLKSS